MSSAGKNSLQPRKILRVAGHEYKSTVLTKGFIIGVFILPAILLAAMPLVGLLINAAKPPPVRGRLAVIDRTELVANRIVERLAEENIAAERGAKLEAVTREAEKQLGAFADQVPGGLSGAAAAAADSVSVPVIRVDILEPDSDADVYKDQVREEMRSGTPLDDANARRLLGVVIIAANAIDPNMPEPGNASSESGVGDFELFIDKKIDARTVGDIQSAISDAIKDARFAAAGLDPQQIASLQRVNDQTQEITEEGTRKSNKTLSMMLPGGFMLLILISVFTGGQYLLTTTIEEKSSRVVEVLLSSVSAMELMTGKVIGQMLVGLTIMSIFMTLAISAALYFDVDDVIEPLHVVAMLVFFVLAYFMFASLMAAAGSAVNELREAQSLMTPIMLLAMVPYFLFMPVSLAPKAIYSVVLSYVPPINPFIMMIRVASTDPPPMWEVLLSIAVGVLGCLVCVWFTAKVFRVGLLMYGKPPNLMTLIKWVRMA